MARPGGLPRKSGHSGEAGGDSWGKLGDNFRKGGETWIAGSYDPDLNLTYWGIAQAKPWMPASRGTTVFDQAAKDPRPRHPEKAHKPDTAAPKKPDWIRVRAPNGPGYAATRDIVREQGQIEVACDFCGVAYRFDAIDTEQIFVDTAPGSSSIQ